MIRPVRRTWPNRKEAILRKRPCHDWTATGNRARLMTDAEWLVSTNLPAMLDALGERLSVRKARLFVCACCRRLEAVSAHGDTAAIVQIGERAADGAVPPRELSYQEVEADKRLTNSGCPYRERGLLCRCLQRIAGRPGAR